MTIDSLEQPDGGVLRDSQGRRQFVAVAKHAAAAVTDRPGAGTLFDADGREQVVILGPDGRALSTRVDAVESSALWRKSSARLRATENAPPLTTPPTITPGTGISAIASSVLTSYTSPIFTYTGAAPVVAYSGNTNYGKPPNLKGESGSYGPAYRVSFLFQGQKLEWRTFYNGGAFRIWVNGQPATYAMTTLASTSADGLVLVDFGARLNTPALIEIEQGPFFFGGIRCLPTDMLAKAEKQSPLVGCVVGDSFAWGAGPATADQGSNYVLALQRALGIDHIINAGVAGTGFLADNSGGAFKYRDRFAQDVIPYAPDLVILQGSTNDRTFAAGLTQAEVAQCIATLRAALPSAKIITTGVLYAGVQDTTRLANSAEVAAAAAAAGIDHVDTTTYVTGTGRLGATTGDGTADFYRNTDGVHPSPAGDDYLGRRLGVDVRRILGIGA